MLSKNYEFVEMIDCGESDSITEIYGRLDKSNTYTGLVVSAIFQSLFQEFLLARPFP